MDLWHIHPHPQAGPGREAWASAIETWLRTWSPDDASEGWTSEDGPLMWPEYVEELEDQGLNVAPLPVADYAEVKALFLEVYLKALTPSN